MVMDDDLRRALVAAVGRVAFNWSNDEPNAATGFTLINEANRILDAVIDTLDEEIGLTGNIGAALASIQR